MSKRAFKTAEDFEQKFAGYLAMCEINKNLPNVAGFCVYAKINRDTFYAQKELYSDTFKRINDMLEDAAINCKGINDTFKIFYMKNKFDYKDRQDIDANIDSVIKVELKDD